MPLNWISFRDSLCKGETLLTSPNAHAQNGKANMSPSYFRLQVRYIITKINGEANVNVLSFV